MLNRVSTATSVLVFLTACIFVSPSLAADSDVVPISDYWSRIEASAPVPGFAGVDASMPDASEGDLVAQSRTDAFISALEKETIDESFANLHVADNFDYPGFAPSGPWFPFTDRHTILSNRRFAKLYEDLRALSPSAQYDYLAKYFGVYMNQMSTILSQFRLENSPELRAANYDHLIRLTQVQGAPPTFYGTRWALQSVVLLSGMLGNTEMWPVLSRTFREPVFAVPVDETQYDKVAIKQWHEFPVFPAAVQADVIVLLVMNAAPEETAKAGLDADKVRSIVAAEDVTDTDLVDYRCRVSQYDVHHTLGKWPIDRTRGAYRLTVLSARKGIDDVCATLVKAAVPQTP